MSGNGDERADKPSIKRQIEELDYQGETEALERLTEESKQTLKYQIDSLNDIDSKAISILRVNVLLIGLLFTAASFVADSSFNLESLDNWAFYTGIISLLLSSALAALTYTASDSEVGIESEKIEKVIDADLSHREFEIAAAQSHIRWIWFNNRTNVINALLITLTNLALIIGLSHLAFGVYLALDGTYSGLIGITMWVLLLVLIISSQVINQLKTFRKEVDLRELRPW
jgi:hypothetical protein